MQEVRGQMELMAKSMWTADSFSLYELQADGSAPDWTTVFKQDLIKYIKCVFARNTVSGHKTTFTHETSRENKLKQKETMFFIICVK